MWGDLVGFVYGSPFLLDLDAVGPSEHRVYTSILNRILLFLWSPYYLVMVMFVTTSVIHVSQILGRKLLRTAGLGEAEQLVANPPPPEAVTEMKKKGSTCSTVDTTSSSRNCSKENALYSALNDLDGTTESTSATSDEVELLKSAPPAVARVNEEVSKKLLREKSKTAELESARKDSAAGSTAAPSSVEEPATWTIYGRQYDLTKFMETHPGGTWPLELSKNSDCTILFESYHTFISREKLGKMMAPYEVNTVRKASSKDSEDEAAAAGESELELVKAENPRLALPPLDPLHHDLKEYCKDYFGKMRDDRQQRGWYAWLKTLTVGRPHNMTVILAIAQGSCVILNWYFQYRAFFKGELLSLLLFPVSSLFGTVNVYCSMWIPDSGPFFTPAL